MKRLAICAILAISGACFAQKATELGPAPIGNGSYTGRVAAIACDPTNASRFYVGGADGGVWRTLDGGATWKPLTDFMPTTAIGALAVDPTNPQVIYAGSGEANYANHSRYGLGLYKSTDGGDTWSVLGAGTFAGRCFSKIVIDPSNTQVLYASITPAGGFPEKAAAKGHPQANGPIGVFKSTDGGVSWGQLTSGLPNQAATDLVINPTNPQILYAAIGRIFGATENGIYKTTNGGSSWTKLVGGLPTTTLGRISLGISASNPARLYALITNSCDAAGNNGSTKGAYRTSDNGTTWTSIPVGSMQATYGWYLSTVAVQPTNPDVVIMGGFDIKRSTDAGATWSTVTAPHVDNHALAWDASGNLLNGNDGGVYRSANLGTNWTALNSGLGTIQLYAGIATSPTDPFFILGGMQDNGCNRRSTNTKVWTQVINSDGGWCEIDQTTPTRVFASYQGTGSIFRSTNSGNSFSQVNSGITGGDRSAFFSPFLIDPANSQHMLYGTHRVYESTNGGTSWTAISPDVTAGSGAIRSIVMAPSNPLVVYVATNDGLVSCSTDGGHTFTQRISGNPGWPRITREICVDPTNDQIVYLAGSVFGVDQIRRSTDRGVTWATMDSDLPDVPVNVLAIDPRFKTLYAGTDDGLYRADMNGTHWTRFANAFPHAPVIDIKVEPQRSRLVVATQGRGVWSVQLPVSR